MPKKRKWIGWPALVVATIVLLPPLCGMRGSRSDYCPICGESGKYSFLQIYGITFKSDVREMGPCLGDDHRPFLKSKLQEGIAIFARSHAGGYASSWYVRYNQFLGPWLREDLDGADRQLVFRALQEAKVDEIDQFLHPDDFRAEFDPVGWAKKVLEPPVGSR